LKARGKNHPVYDPWIWNSTGLKLYEVTEDEKESSLCRLGLRSHIYYSKHSDKLIVCEGSKLEFVLESNELEVGFE